MKALQVRDLPENIYYLLQKNAKNNCRSLSGEAIVTLAKGLETRISNKDRREKLLSMIKKNTLRKKRSSEYQSCRFYKGGQRKVIAVVDTSAAVEVVLKRQSAEKLIQLIKDADWILV